MSKPYIVFDLDDTLYKEIDFLKSGYNKVCETFQIDCFDEMLKLYFEGKDVFKIICDKYLNNVKVEELVKIYRTHFPNLKLSDEVNNVLETFKKKGCNLGVVTDGRSITQRNKLKALGIIDFFDKIVISEEIGSEKPSLNNFRSFMDGKSHSFFYVGDNINKDFYGPNQLGWETIQLVNNDKNIVREKIEALQNNYYPKYCVINFNEILKICLEK